MHSELLPRSTLARLARCMAVSVGTTVLSTTILITLAVGVGMRAGTANVIAVTCGIIPSYLGNRRWAWGRTGRGSISREVVPFWVLSLTGLVVSTLLVDWVGAWSADWSGLARAVVLPVANLTVFGFLWVVQFVLLDRVIFREHTQAHVHAPVPSLEHS